MLIPLSSLVLQASLPSAPEVIRRSQQAYDAVRTLEQDVKGQGVGYSGTAHILFSRPGRLRVTGQTGFGTPYELLCDGKATWVLNNGSWARRQSPEMGIATITGISAGAGTLTPAMLMHSNWGRLSPLVAEGWKVRAESKNGRRLLRVEDKKSPPSKTWFDAATYFVVRKEDHFNGITMTEEFSRPKVNGPIPAARFKR